MRFQPPPEFVEKASSPEPSSDAKAAQDTSHPSGERVGDRTGGGGDQREGRMKWRQRGEGGEREHTGGMSRGENRPERKMARIWVLDANKNMKSVMVQLGLNDNRYVELVGGDLKEGDEVVIGIQSAEAGSASNSTTNPFQPRPMGGTGGGGRGRM